MRFQTLRKLLTVLSLPLLALAVLPSCGDIKPKSPPDTLRVTLSAEPNTLNPITASDAYASNINRYLYDDLIRRNPDTFEFEPDLATAWEISSDHLRYTFHLRKDVKWHDGHPFTTDDVVYSFERIMDPKVEAPFLRVYYADVLKVEKLDDYTVRFVYNRPYFLGLSVCGEMPVVPKHLYEKGGDFNSHELNRKPVGMGPYKLTVWETNKKMVLERNEDYWGKKPAIKRIEYRIISDDTVALQVLKKGDLDLASMRPIQWVRQTNSEKFSRQFNRHKYLQPGYSYIGWNNKSPFFEDKRVRQAMTYLVNREKLLEKIQFDLGVIVTGHFFLESPQYDKSVQPYPYDPQKSRELLKQAGWEDHDGDGILDKDGRAFSFKFLYPAGSKFAERLSTIMKEDLAKMGIVMDIERMEWAAFLNRIDKKEFDATSMAWSSSFEGDPYQVWHSSQGDTEKGSNFISYKNPEVDRLIEAARVEFNDNRRNELYHKFHRILHEDQPYTFLFTSYSLVAVASRFDNVIVHKAGLRPEEWLLRMEKPE